MQNKDLNIKVINTPITHQLSWCLQKLKVSLLDTVCNSHPNIKWGVYVLLYPYSNAWYNSSSGFTDERFQHKWILHLLKVRGAVFPCARRPLKCNSLHNIKSIPFSLVMHILPFPNCRLRNAALWGILNVSVGAWFQLLYAICL